MNMLICDRCKVNPAYTGAVLREPVLLDGGRFRLGLGIQHPPGHTGVRNRADTCRDCRIDLFREVAEKLPGLIGEKMARQTREGCEKEGQGNDRQGNKDEEKG